MTLAFQSHVCLSTSNDKPEGQVICFSPERVHLQKTVDVAYVEVVKEERERERGEKIGKIDIREMQIGDA